jgi:hypothetical protein
MGWRDRDWAKFTPDEFDAIYGGGASKPLRSGTGRGRRPDPGRQRGSGPARRRSERLVRAARILLASLVGFAAVFTLYVERDRLPSLNANGKNAQRLHISPLPLSVAAPPVDPKLMTIRWRTRDLAPAANAGRICVTDKRHGRICASYVVGERPADNLTRRIESLGFRVESSG